MRAEALQAGFRNYARQFGTRERTRSRTHATSADVCMWVCMYVISTRDGRAKARRFSFLRSIARSAAADGGRSVGTWRWWWQPRRVLWACRGCLIETLGGAFRVADGGQRAAESTDGDSTYLRSLSGARLPLAAAGALLVCVCVEMVGKVGSRQSLHSRRE